MEAVIMALVPPSVDCGEPMRCNIRAEEDELRLQGLVGQGGKPATQLDQLDGALDVWPPV
jgi:hypothetical protein